MNPIEAAILDLYNIVDVPPPSAMWPIAPLKPIVDRLPVRCVELPALTCKSALDYLGHCGAMPSRAPFVVQDQATEPLAGFAYQGGECAFLFVNGDDPVVRRRFSVAHELGHYVLHFRPVVHRWLDALAAGEDVPATLYDAFTVKEIESIEDPNSSGSHASREWEANAFAAALLLPPELVVTRTKAFRSAFPGDQAGLEDYLAMEFLVSRAAVRRRIADIGSEGADDGRYSK